MALQMEALNKINDAMYGSYSDQMKTIKFIYMCGDQLTPELLFRLRRLGLWPNNPVRGRERIRGLSDKKEMKWYYGKRPSIFVVDLTVSEEDVHLGTSVRGG